MTLIKLLLFALSTLGFFELLRMAGRDQIQIHFLPSLTIGVQVSVLFFAFSPDSGTCCRRPPGHCIFWASSGFSCGDSGRNLWNFSGNMPISAMPRCW